MPSTLVRLSPARIALTSNAVSLEGDPGREAWQRGALGRLRQPGLPQVPQRMEGSQDRAPPAIQTRQPADSSLMAPASEPAFRMPPSSNTRPAAWGYRASHNAFGPQRHREVRRTMYLFDAVREHLDPSVQIRNQQSSGGQCDLRKCRSLTSRLHST